MSAPTKAFNNLSLGGEMSVARAGSLEQEEKPLPNIDVASESESEEESSSDDDGVDDPLSGVTVQGRSSITYDLQRLSPDSRVKARYGLTGDFFVEKCRPIYGGGYDFQVVDQGRVYVGDGPMKCACRDFQKSELACRHIYWLVDQLHRWVLPGRPSSGLQLSQEGECATFDPMLDLIGDKMEGICKKLKWAYVAAPGTPADLSQYNSTYMTRPEKARDLLSAFSTDTLPDEFRPELVETITQPRTLAQCVVQGDFEATMFRLAVHDESVYASLRKVMPSGARSAIFFDKIQRRLRALFSDFKQYQQSGFLRQSGCVALEVDVVAEEIRAYLRQIQKNMLSRCPHGFKGASETLLYLLRATCQYNYDAFEGNMWNRPSAPGEAPEDRNLYFQLVYNMIDDDEFFVLSCLELLPEDSLQQIAPQLDTIFSDMQVNSAPVPYLRKLHSIIAGDVSAKSSAATGGHKRPAAGASVSGRKRTK